ncbi:MAG: phosphatase PAP2 family protein [Bdellovibrionales bacterium]|nr:phosphatase PAP2 family protein [Bdellovibrionales bacterium]
MSLPQASARATREIDWSPRNSELVLLVFLPLYLGLIWNTHLPLSIPLLKAFAFKGAQLVGGVYLLAVPLVISKALWWRFSRTGVTRLDREVWRAAANPFCSTSFLFLSMKRAVVVLGSIYLFLHLKHLILWFHTANYDQFFWDLDRWLHFGVQPNIALLEFLSGYPAAQVMLDWLYMKYFDFMLLVAVLFMLEPRSRKLSDAFFTAYSLFWLVGGLSYFAYPADGPCYAMLAQYSVGMDTAERAHLFRFPLQTDLPEKYLTAYQEAKIPTAKYFQQRLWKDRQVFLAGKGYPGAFYGVAAMPSLHVAAVTMMSVFLFAVSGLLGLLGTAFLVVTLVGSVVLQWHYAIDGYAGVIFGLATAFLALRTPRLLGRCGDDDLSQFRTPIRD